MFNSFRVAFFITIRNIFRNGFGISVMTILMMVLVFINLLFPPALLQGLIDTVNTKLVETLSGNIIIEPESGDPFLENVDELVAELEKVEGVEAVSRRIDLGTEGEFAGRLATFNTQVVDPQENSDVFAYQDYMLEGEFLSFDDEDKIVLGTQVAGCDDEELELYFESLQKVHVGDKVEVSFPGAMPMEYEVKGVLSTDFLQTDMNAFITGHQFSRLQPNRDDMATSLHVKTKARADEFAVIDRVKDKYGNLEVLHWEEVAGIMNSITTTFEIVINILRVIGLLVAAVTIFIVTFIDLVNKRKQIGIQRAIGITSRAILLSYVWRAIFYSVIGIVLGQVIFSYVVIPLEHRYPFHFPFGDAFFRTDLHESFYLFVALLVVSIIAALLPTIKTLRQKILDAIWGGE